MLLGSGAHTSTRLSHSRRLLSLNNEAARPELNAFIVISSS
jgi:hypothetical protein